MLRLLLALYAKELAALSAWHVYTCWAATSNFVSVWKHDKLVIQLNTCPAGVRACCT